MEVDRKTPIELAQRLKKIIEKVDFIISSYSRPEKIKEFLPIFLEKDCPCKIVILNLNFSFHDIKIAISPILTEGKKTLENMDLRIELGNY